MAQPDASSGNALIDAEINQPWIGGVTAAQSINHGAAAQSMQTVDGFQNRRRTHMMETNEHNYAEKLGPEDAVFKYAPLEPGPMAKYLDKTSASPEKPDPAGRARQGGDFFQKEVPLYQ